MALRVDSEWNLRAATMGATTVGRRRWRTCGSIEIRPLGADA